MQHILYLKDFGVRADGVSNATSAMAKAIEAASQLDESVELILEEGEYLLFAESALTAAIILKNIQNLTITGIKGKTLFTIKNPGIGTFLLHDCENITLRNIIIDYDPLPYTQGTILGIQREEGSLDLDIDEGYELPDEQYFADCKLRIGMRANRRGDETEYSRHSLLASHATKIKDRVYRIHTSATNQFHESNAAYEKLVFAKDHLQVGDHFFYMALQYTQAAVCVWRSRNITISDITVYAGPAITTMWAVSETIHIDHLVIEIKPDTDRLLSVNADGVHALGIRGGILMENCNISGNGDDGVNIHSRSGFVTDVYSDHQIRIKHYGSCDYRVGDTLQIMNHGKIKATVQVLEITYEGSPAKGDAAQMVTFEPAVQGIKAGTKLADSDNVLNLSECCQGSVFRNNVFGIGCGRSMLLSSHDILVENNLFKNINGWAINLSYDANYGEGPQPYNFLIRNNTFKGVGCSRLPTFFLHAITPWSGGTIPGDHPIHNIRIENNTFIDPRNTILSADGVKDLHFHHNQIIATREPPENDAPLINITNSEEMTIENLIIDPPSSGKESIIRISDSVAPGEEGVIIRNISSVQRACPIRIEDHRPG